MWGDNFGLNDGLNVPRAKVYRTAAIGALATGVAGTVSFDTVEYDTDGMANPLGVFLTCRTAGLYVAQGQATYNDGFVGPFRTRLLRNNNAAQPLADDGRVDAAFRGAGGNTQVTVTGFWVAQAGDTLQLYLLATASNATLAVGQYTLFLSACLISTI
jgi:hypothetical protein